MTLTQSAVPKSNSLNPFVIDTSIAHPHRLNPVLAKTDVLTNNSVIAKCVTEVVNSLTLNPQQKSPQATISFATGIIGSNYDDQVYVVDGARIEEIQIAAQRRANPKDLKSFIHDILQQLRIPIVNNFVDKLILKIESINQSANEIPEDQPSNPPKICTITGLEIKKRRMRDPVHNLIEFKGNQLGCIIWAIIESPIFQRLREIKQLGVSEFVYPGATHSRFQHSLGVYHNAGMILDILRELPDHEFNEERAEAVLVAALLHDIGHGPFSHAFEGFCREAELKGAEHETISEEIILDSEITELLNKYREGFAKEVADMVAGKHREDAYAAIVSSQFDADRLDYLQRDQLMTGSQNSIIDLAWLFSNIEIRKIPIEIEPNKIIKIETIVFNAKTILALQTYILALFNLYHSVYFHPVTRAAEQIFKNLMLRIHKLVQCGDLDKVNLALDHPIMKFMQNPNNRENVLNLDDKVIRGALVNLMNSEDSIVADLATRFKYRQLPKAFDIREKVDGYFLDEEFELYSKEEREEFIDESVGKFLKRAEAYSSKLDEEQQFWFDSGSRVAYKAVSKKFGKLDTIQVLKNGKVYGIEKLSEVVNVAGIYKFDRVYLPFEDTETLNFLNSQISICCKEVSQNGLQSK